MSAHLDYASPERPPPFRFPAKRVVGVVLFCAALLLLVRPFLVLLTLLAFHGTSNSVSPDQSGRSVAVSLMNWGVFGSVPNREPEYTDLVNSTWREVNGIRGYTESDGFHGDGTDWYEVELSPELAAELRASLPRVTTVRNGKVVQFEQSAPSWWPKSWPADSKTYDYKKYPESLVLPDSGTRAWFVRVRT